MSQTRSNHEAWTTENDQLLLQTVLQHSRDGSSQKKAFEEAAVKLGRTPGACAFRFNSVLRKHYSYENSSTSKKEETNTPQNIVEFPKQNNVLSWKEVLSFLDSQSVEVSRLQEQMANLQEENIHLRKELEQQQKTLAQLESLGINVSRMLEILKFA